MTTATKTGQWTGVVHSGQEIIHNLGEHVHATASKPRELIHRRRRHELLRELGQLHFDAHASGDEPDQGAIDRLIMQLEADARTDRK